VKILRRLLKPKKLKRDLKAPLPPGIDPTLSAIWRYLPGTGRPRKTPRSAPDVLILQIGKVASLALQDAVNRYGFNAMHSHAVSPQSQHQQLDFVLAMQPNPWSAYSMMDVLVQATALHQLLKWYQRHKTRDGHRLKVITLTREPVAWYCSAFIQIWTHTAPGIADWWRRRLNLPDDATVDPVEALRQLLAEAVPLVAAARPSLGCDAARAEANRRAAMDGNMIVPYEVDRLIRPLDWFANEIQPQFGFDVLAAPALANGGVVRMENEFSELLALRYEDITINMPEIGRFLGVADFTIDRRNVTEDKSAATEIMPVLKGAFATPEGRVLAHELRHSPYGKACGYDRLD
jgi:hypothetical protein